MDKKELIIFGLMALVAVLLIYYFAWPKQQIVVVEQPAVLPAIPEAAPELPAQISQEAPQIEQPVEMMQPEEMPAETPPAPAETPQEDGLVFGDEIGAAQQPVPVKANLVPYYTEFQVNKIIIPPYFAYAHIPIKEDRIRTFAGKFGPYHYDYRQYVDVELCSSLLNSPDMVVCEKIYDLNYIDNFITFVRGYPPDEYIANMAMREFGAFFVVKDKNKEVIAKSNIAPIKLVHD